MARRARPCPPPAALHPGLRQPTHQPRAPRNPPPGYPCSAPFVPCFYALPEPAKQGLVGPGPAHASGAVNPPRCRLLLPTHAVCLACVFSHSRCNQLALPACPHLVAHRRFICFPLPPLPLFKLRGPILPHTDAHAHTRHLQQTHSTLPCPTPHATFSPVFSPLRGSFFPHATPQCLRRCRSALAASLCPNCLPRSWTPFPILSLPARVAPLPISFCSSCSLPLPRSNECRLTARTLMSPPSREAPRASMLGADSPKAP